MFRVATDADAAARHDKIRRKYANIRNQETLDKVLNSLPGHIRDSIFVEITPLLRFKPLPDISDEALAERLETYRKAGQ